MNAQYRSYSSLYMRSLYHITIFLSLNYNHSCPLSSFFCKFFKKKSKILGLMTTFLNITPISHIEHLFAHPFIGDFSASEEKNARKSPFFGAIFPIFQKVARTSVRFYVFFPFPRDCPFRGAKRGQRWSQNIKNQNLWSRVAKGSRFFPFSMPRGKLFPFPMPRGKLFPFPMPKCRRGGGKSPRCRHRRDSRKIFPPFPLRIYNAYTPAPRHRASLSGKKEAKS